MQAQSEILEEIKRVDNYIKIGRLLREEEKFEQSVAEFSKALELCRTEENVYLKNKVLNEIEISQRKTVLESKPRGLSVVLTTRCNLKCKMCEVWENNKDIRENTVKQIIDYYPYLELILWQGGEVFLSDYFEKLFDEASKYPHLHQQVITNGLLIDEKLAQKLVKGNFELVISIDSIIKSTYENIRRGAKFDDLLERINLINLYKEKLNKDLPPSSKMITTINVTAMKSNYRELALFADFAKEYKFDRLVITPIKNVFAGFNEEDIFLAKDPLVEDTLKKTSNILLQKAEEYKITVLNWLPLNGESQKKDGSNETASLLKRREILCYWPWQFMMMDGDEIKPQCPCIKTVGNLNKSSLEEIWNSEMMQLYREKIINNDYSDFCDARCISGAISTEDLGFR